MAGPKRARFDWRHPTPAPQPRQGNPYVARQQAETAVRRERKRLSAAEQAAAEAQEQARQSGLDALARGASL